MRQLLLNILPAPIPTRSNWVTGNNQEAVSMWSAWLDNPEFHKNSGCGFYVFGAQGAGKTHLLLASGFPYIDAQENPSLTELPASDSTSKAIAVDNVHLLDATGQQALFNLFNRIHATSGHLLMAGDTSPKNLPLREDLRTRLGYGLVYGLQTLDDDKKLTALTQMARERQLRVGAELFPYLIRHTARDMGNLSTLLVALDQYALEHQRAITLPLLRELLQTTSTEQQP